MEEDRPSRTAEVSAIHRALHQTLDADPKILSDPVAARLLDPSSDFYKSAVEGLERIPASVRLKRRGYMVMRGRFTEDCMAESLARGIGQYIILGAGLDTFGYRQPSWAKSLHVFQVDHPATQRWKRAKLAAATVQIPDNVSFAPIDFEKVSLKEGLTSSGFAFSIPTFFSWLGVTLYLTEGAFHGTLKFVLTMPRSSEIVFDFMVPEHLMPPDQATAVRAVAAQTAERGEPILRRFVPEEFAANLGAMGFSKVAHLSPKAAHDRHFSGRQDGLDAPAVLQIMRAIL
jgi:methyltransferase (TIGR00027 family)